MKYIRKNTIFFILNKLNSKVFVVCLKIYRLKLKKIAKNALFSQYQPPSRHRIKK